MQPSREAAGTILQVDDRGIHAAVAGGTLIISRIKTETGKKLAGAELAAELGIKAGDRFIT
jgi:hypothetical protein